jgi:hypothetical protein
LRCLVSQYPNPLLSNDGLMGLGGVQNASFVMCPRYDQHYLDYMNSLNPTGRFSLIAVPLPSAVSLFPVAAPLVLPFRPRLSRKAA